MGGPVRAADQVIAVGERRDAVIADMVIGRGPDQAIGAGNGARDTGRAATPGNGSFGR